MPAMYYRAITVDDFMSLFARLSRARVCIDGDIRGNVSVQSTRVLPWPVLLQQVAAGNGLNADNDQSSVYLFRGKR